VTVMPSAYALTAGVLDRKAEVGLTCQSFYEYGVSKGTQE